MDDSFSPPPQHVGEYWSWKHCCWVPSPVPIPEQRTTKPAHEPAHADGVPSVSSATVAVAARNLDVAIPPRSA